METAIAFAIPSGVHATKVWDTIQKDVQKLILAGKAEQIWLVVAQVGGDHRAVAGGAAAARAAHDIGGSCRVCETRDAVREAKRRWAVKAGEQSAVVTPIRRRKTGQQGT